MTNFFYATVLATFVIGLMWLLSKVHVEVHRVRDNKNPYKIDGITENCFIVSPEFAHILIEAGNTYLHLENEDGSRTRLDVVDATMCPSGYCAVIVRGKIVYHGPIRKEFFKNKENAILEKLK